MIYEHAWKSGRIFAERRCYLLIPEFRRRGSFDSSVFSAHWGTHGKITGPGLPVSLVHKRNVPVAESSSCMVGRKRAEERNACLRLRDRNRKLLPRQQKSRCAVRRAPCAAKMAVECGKLPAWPFNSFPLCLRI